MRKTFYLVCFSLFMFCMLLVATGECQETEFSDSMVVFNKTSIFTPIEMKDKKVEVLKEAYKFAILAGAIYLFRGNLEEFSYKHNRITHLILGCAITQKFGWKFAAGFIIAKEATQIDIFGIKGRYKDTFLDFVYYSIGATLAVKF